MTERWGSRASARPYGFFFFFFHPLYFCDIILAKKQHKGQRVSLDLIVGGARVHHEGEGSGGGDRDARRIASSV